jgi:hypothetical protein
MVIAYIRFIKNVKVNWNVTHQRKLNLNKSIVKYDALTHII